MKRTRVGTAIAVEPGGKRALASAIEFGAGPGWDPAALYTTGDDGTVHRLVLPRS